MISEYQVTEGFESWANALVANVKNNESTTVHNAVEFEIPPAQVGILIIRIQGASQNRPNKESTAFHNVSARHRSGPN